MNLFDRASSPTPKIFRILRAVGIGIVSTGGAVLSLPVVLPIIVTNIATYLIVAGSVLSAVSQITVDIDKNETQ